MGVTDAAGFHAPPAGRPRITCRPLQPGDLSRAARIHAAALPHGFFVELGPAFLAAYYGTFVRSPHAVAYAAVVDGRVVGSLVGTVANRAHYAWVLRHASVRLAARGSVSMLVRPHVAARFLRTRVRRYLRGLRRLGRHDGDTAGGPQGPVAVLTHVSVDPGARGIGVGGMLVDAFWHAAQAFGADQAMLVTLAGEKGAGRFYAERGWSRHAERVDHDGRPISVYAASLR